MIGYARFYQQLFDLMPHERPDDTVVQNDQELDAWWERFIQDKTRQLARSMTKPGSPTHGVSFMGEASNAVPQFSA